MMKRYALLLVCLLLSGVSAASEDEVQAGIFATYLKLAEQGDMNAQYIVAHRYEIGKGTGADRQKANYWYDRAAAKGHPLALRKVEERQPPVASTHDTPAPRAGAERPGSTAVASETPAVKPPQAVAPPKPPVAAPAVSAPKSAARMHEPPKPKPQVTAARQEKPSGAAPVTGATETKAKELPAVAKAVAEHATPTPSINLMATVLGAHWSRNRQPAEFLPSGYAACLQSSGTEIVCFSRELTRNVTGSVVTFNVKSTLSGLDNREGKFTLSYVYNVLHVSKPEAEVVVTDAGDLLPRTGWQEPGHSLDCRFSDERSVTCTRADRKLSYQFARD